MARRTTPRRGPGGHHIDTAGTGDWEALTEPMTLALGQRSRNVAITSRRRASIGLWSYCGSGHVVSARNESVISGRRLASPERAEAFCRPRLGRDGGHFFSAGIMTGSTGEVPREVGNFSKRDHRPRPRGDRVSALPVGSACGRLWHGDRPVELRAKAGALLRYLAGRPGALVTKEELYAAVWGDVVASDDTLTETLGELRRALRDDPRAPRAIETVHRRGLLGRGIVSRRRELMDDPGAPDECARLRRRQTQQVPDVLAARTPHRHLAPAPAGT